MSRVRPSTPVFAGLGLLALGLGAAGLHAAFSAPGAAARQGIGVGAADGGSAGVRHPVRAESGVAQEAGARRAKILADEATLDIRGRRPGGIDRGAARHEPPYKRESSDPSQTKI